jgi:UDP-glucose 4-epimerase
MKCLVTGGAGFVGSNLVDKLIEEGHEVIIVDDMSTGKSENINSKATIWVVDIADVDEDWEEIFDGAEIVFHLAAKARVQPSIDNPVEFDRTNVGGLLNMLDCSRKYGVKRFIYSSSSSVYGDVKELPTSEGQELNPLSPYALQKLMGEQYCKLFSELYGLETTCLRYFNVYGERQLLEGAYCLVMGKFSQQKLNGKPMTIRGDGEQRRDFTYVGDVVDANIRCMNYPLELNGDIFNIGNGDNRSVNQIADLIGGDRVNVEPVIEPKETLADNNKAKRILGWKTTTKIEDWIVKYKEDIGI